MTLAPTVPAQVFVTPTNGLSVKDAAGATWTLSKTGVATKNGVAVAGGTRTAYLTSVSGVIWGEDSLTLQWYHYSPTGWVAGTLPVAAPNPPSPTPVAPGHVTGVKIT